MSHPPGFQRRTLWDRYARRLGGAAKPVLTLAVVAIASGAFRIVQAVLATPAQVKALKIQVDSVAAQVMLQGNDLRDVSEATWTFVALRCLEMNDSAFVSSRLPCGKAFMISGVVRRLSR